MQLDETHDPQLASWVGTANGHPDFPIQNLPLGLFSVDGGRPRTGIAIGDFVLDLASVAAAGVLEGEALDAARAACAEPTLNRFLGLGAEPRRALRRGISRLFAAGSPHAETVRACLHPASQVTMHLPVAIGDYTDFYAGIHHAVHVGKLFRPDNPLLPNYRHVPIGYHGRASSVLPSGIPFRRPAGQLKLPDADGPLLAPTKRLDFELELGIWIGPENAHGERIDIGDADSHIAGFCLLNDWSARDVQAWEYQPLGPFLAKSFASTVSPWVVTPEALAPFRRPAPARAEGDPAPLPYLTSGRDQAQGGLDLELEVLILTAAMARQGLSPHRLALSHTRHLYWTVAQFVAHHTVNGCNLRSGDLLGSGTISGPENGQSGSLLEATNGGREPLALPSGETRVFLEDGDEIILKAHARKPGFAPLGLGECRARILPALPVG